MALQCPVCQTYSTTYDFCEHCQADLRAIVAILAPAVCPLEGGEIALTDEQRAHLADPEHSLLVNVPSGWRRVHWLDRRADPEWHAAWNFRQRTRADVLPDPHEIETDAGAWIVVPSTGRITTPWSTARRSTPLEELQQLVAFAGELAETFEALHRLGLFWLNFDPTEIERDADGRLVVGNLDVRVFPIGHAPHVLTVHQSYTAPEVVYLRAADLGPRTDVFHLSVFCYYWLARRLPGGLSGDGLEADDFHLPALRIYAPLVPEGVAAILARGMSLEAGPRYPTPNALVADLKDALERAQRRRAFDGAVAWDIGFRSVAGRAKTALKRGNEDQAFVRRFLNPDRALVAVADGITTCDVGDGALASLIATVVLENAFDASSRGDDFDRRIAEVCRRGSQTLLDWAIEKGHSDRLLAGADLMGSTLTTGWLEGNTFQLANLGDSRAYLIEGGRVEQLTVDGDLASDLLTQDSPPENVRDLGAMGKALRRCIGGCDVAPDGTLMILEDASTPSLSTWKLLPGDVVVLCTDGLVEEGAFLEPELLVQIHRNHPRASAQELAELLVDAADALQRIPSVLEPDGFGDNVSCVVIKVLEGQSQMNSPTHIR